MSEQRPDPEEIGRAVARGRRQWVTRLSREYRPIAARLLEAYGGVEFDLSEVGDPESGLYRPGNPGLPAFRRRIADAINSLRGEIIDQGATAQASGVTIGGEYGAGMLQAGGIGVAFNQPLAEALAAAIDYVDSAAWRSAVERLGAYHADKVANMVLTGIASGRNPREISRAVRNYLLEKQVPLNDVYNLVQTTQVYAARRGALAIYRETGVDQWRWSAAIGNSRTCRACVAMHGTVHPVTEMLNDHHRGRCAAIPITPSWRELGFPDGREPAFETGVDWFNRQDAATQRAVLRNDRLFAAIQAGEVAFTPEMIVGTYDNDVFGRMRRARSFVEIVGASVG